MCGSLAYQRRGKTTKLCGTYICRRIELNLGKHYEETCIFAKEFYERKIRMEKKKKIAIREKKKSLTNYCNHQHPSHVRSTRNQTGRREVEF